MIEDRALVLYGSQARGDADSISDVDVLVAGTTAPLADEIAALLPEGVEGPLHASHYTWNELKAMSRYGSLFLHHVAAEARPIRYEGKARARLSALLTSLGPYRLARRDLLGFRTTVRDVQEGLQAGLPPCFELAVFGGVARHASVLGCYLAGVPTFGRNSIAEATTLFGVRSAQEDLELAHRFRLFEEGQCAVPSQVSRDAVERILDVLNVFLSRLEKMIHADAE